LARASYSIPCGGKRSAFLDPHDEVFDHLAEGSGIGVLGRQHQHREDDAARRRHHLETAGQTGQIGLRARRRRIDRELPALHRGIGVGKPAAGEHRIRKIGRRPEARDADVGARGADRRHRHQRHPQHQIEVVAHPARGRGKRLARAVEIGGRDREARAVAAEHKGEFAAFQRIGDRGDHRGAGHVHRLVALRRDRLGRFNDIGDAD
jgi:hypothetical protein